MKNKINKEIGVFGHLILFYAFHTAVCDLKTAWTKK